ncbi:helix-turn-helix domain-containing protein [Gelidibacter salicanalis]|uniref:Helix-turn-helix transcriptional regulator n=1 Tax=Gelidibacter salicanalis TaxID=291193 RepID=A0A934NKS4_9FLAO|nr:helix-turn-helix transcriptional regulator [Gelidibacter salicanalis]MBJ7882107.1 helix-turn-helix transcriptional regulator [Gelidibacter salicanalis]
MKIFIKFDFTQFCSTILDEKLDELNIKYRMLNFGEIEFLEPVPPDKLKAFDAILDTYGIEKIENQKVILVQKIKDTLIDMVFNTNDAINVKSSVYLSDKLGHSYGYLSNLFSEVTYTSIENFIILQRIEYAKSLITNTGLSLTEIAFRLQYSSVAHLSTQFKNTTGITPTAFQRIIAKRRELKNNKD